MILICPNFSQNNRVADNARGKQVACGQCKTAIRVPGGVKLDPWDNPAFASPSPQERRGRPRKRKSNTPKIIGFIVAGIFGIGLITAVIIAGVSSINSDSERDKKESKNKSVVANGKSSIANGLFARPPADPRVIVTNNNWQPNENVTNELESVQTVCDFSIRVPKGIRLRPKRPGDSYPYAGYWTRRSQPPYDV